MRRLIGLVFALVLVFAGLGVVRPQVISRSKAAWGPVAQSLKVMPLEEGASIEISATGEYIVFVEGPAGDTGWSQVTNISVQLIERLSRQPLTSAAQEVDYVFDFGGRHHVAIERVPVKNPGAYDLSAGRAAWSDLGKRGFQIALSPVKIVDGQAWKSRLWLVGGIVAGVLMGLVALSMLSAPKL